MEKECCICKKLEWEKENDVIYTNKLKQSFCIFHSPHDCKFKLRMVVSSQSGDHYANFEEGNSNQKDFQNYSLEEFNKLVLEKINKPNDTTEVVLSGTIFPGDIDFKDSIGGKVSKSVDVSKSIDLKLSQFYGAANFSNINFKKEVKLNESVFYAKAGFEETCFNEDVDFEKTEFKISTFFVGTEFNEQVNFKDATFVEETFFKMDVPVEDEFGDMFKGDTDFTSVKIDNSVRFENLIVSKIKFLDTDVGKIDYINCEKIEKHDWFSWKLFFVFKDLVFGKYRTFYDEIVYDKKLHGEKGVKKIKSNYLKKIETLQRKMKERFTRDQNWGIVSEHHYGEKIAIRRRLWVDKDRVNLTANVMYWLSSGYNERPIRAIVVLLLMVVGLGMLGSENSDWNNIMNGAEFLPFIKTKGLEVLMLKENLEIIPIKEVSGWTRAGVMAMQTLITIQITLVIMSVRNKLRR